MNIADIDIALKELMCDGIAATGRSFVVWTNDQFHIAMQRTNAIDMLGWMVEEELIKSEQKTTITLMLNSPDMDDFNLALTLIQQIKQSKQNGNNIQSSITHV